ncbi:NB-ARC domain-containing protein [Gluconobacter potus]|uniref:NB-ARC domain-containing protein n=1 Tax=Gluconobacter potus TaxID=2724927 RepID=UPI000B1C857E|nr:NB-ARC domain-containing protein [Gluconobacter potus]
MAANNPLLNASWAYLHRNLSGKYRVVPLGGDQSPFDDLKKAKGVLSENFSPGIYLYSSGFRGVELLHTDVDASDFFIPNGAFRNATFELHSLITDNRMRIDASPYLLPATERPPSETEGNGTLEALGNILTNLPPQTSGYVRRPHLEEEVRSAFINDRHPIITLVGRGGIGKTSVALSVLHSLSELDRFDIVVWFSARDIDLTLAGVKAVKPHVLTEGDIAKEYLRLIGHSDAGKKENPLSVLAQHMTKSPLGATLFVLDNFETARNPIDLFHWIDTNIRLPNKVVITSRFRDFKADYPISVSGMEEGEAQQLIQQTVTSLGIENIVSTSQALEVAEEADGHPYVIKILLGEIANEGKYSKPVRLIARKDDVLEALFERTYASLTPLATRAFLTLCSWRSLVPQLALEAALLRQNDEGRDRRTLD